MPALGRNEWSRFLNRWLDMPLSALLCLVDLCFLTFDNPPISSGRNISATAGTMGGGGGLFRGGFGDLSTRGGASGTPGSDGFVDITKDSSMTERLDAVDIEALMKNTRLFNSYLKCMLETGPCTAEGRELKKEVLEVLHTGCASCSEKTKTRLKKSFLKLKSDPRFRESYKKVLDKYDPDKRYIENLEKFIAR